ncbi:hypothetical protein PMIN03_012288 [Paraphaeosphaeria minitans]|uniref:Uncharacterized protein n=1 Tax=Paraphaeosphaeria minitans TaxID=565426 RepID=A0A9P6GFH5_9PLEO|nr:hypothetical protein PMIN01_07639 [Paraphaeosphaeria minitans]
MASLSPRLPGVMLLRAEATGPEYARWKREIESAFTAKGTWGHCDGSVPMPMPGAGPNFFSPVSQLDMQTTLLEDRKAWVKKDREVKLDIFLSVSDDIKLEVFEVGPPLPPMSMNAKEMLEALDEHYGGFKFEDYHHVFCHFLNLHIDQYTNIEEFNAEFQATLEDLLDHGHPLSNMQACSAYFSKLRCTQNPWVAKQIKVWDSRDNEPQLAQLMQQSPPWSIIRPLTMSTKATSTYAFVPVSIPEEPPMDTPPMDTPPHSDSEDTPSERSVSTISSSKPSHSRDSSNATQRSQEITIHASYEDLTELQLQAFPEVPTGIPALTHIPKRISSISKLSLQSLPPMNRPLPPIPATNARSRSASPTITTPSKPRSKQSSKPPSRLSSPTTSLPGLEQTHPALRSPLPRASTFEPTVTPEQLDLYPQARQPSPSSPPFQPSYTAPELQADVPSAHIAAVMRALTPSPPPTITLLPPVSPETRPTSPRSAVVPPTQTQTQTQEDHFENWAQTRPLLRIESSTNSVLSLPLQGTTHPLRSATPEFADSTISEGSAPPKKAMSRIELARMRYEGKGVGGGLYVPGISDEESKARKRNWSIKARLSARHGIKEII